MEMATNFSKQEGEGVVKPPMVNNKRKPIANSIGVLSLIEPPHIVAVQLKNLIPVL